MYISLDLTPICLKKGQILSCLYMRMPKGVSWDQKQVCKAHILPHSYFPLPSTWCLLHWKYLFYHRYHFSRENIHVCDIRTLLKMPTLEISEWSWEQWGNCLSPIYVTHCACHMFTRALMEMNPSIYVSLFIIMLHTESFEAIFPFLFLPGSLTQWNRCSFSVCLPPSKTMGPEALESGGALDRDEFWTSVEESVNINVVCLFFKKYRIHIRCWILEIYW